MPVDASKKPAIRQAIVIARLLCPIISWETLSFVPFSNALIAMAAAGAADQAVNAYVNRLFAQKWSQTVLTGPT